MCRIRHRRSRATCSRQSKEHLSIRSADRNAAGFRPTQPRRESIAVGRLEFVKRSKNIRYSAARSSIASIFSIAILAAIPSVGRTQDSAPTLETTASSDRLRALVDEALARSPVVLAARSHWQAQTKMPIQAATLPDPEVSLQHFTVGSPQPFSGYESRDFYYSGFGVSQDIPGPGKLRLQKSEAEKDAEYAKHRYESVGRAVE